MSTGYGATRKVWGAEVLPLNSKVEARIRMGQVAAEDQPFTNHGGTVTGEPGPADELGWLPGRFHHMARAATYVVYSFGTPIAWRRNDGVWDIPAVRYGSRTSKHQGFCRSWLGVWEER